METFYSALAICLSVMFLVSAVLKILHFPSFIELVFAYEVLPRFFSKAFAIALPFLELAVSISLLFEQTLVYGTVLSLLLLLSFAYAVIRVLQERKVITCGCYGKFLDTKADGFTVAKISILMILAFTLILGKGSFPVQLTAESLLTGMAMTGVLLVAQAVWAAHQKAVGILKNELRS